MISITKVSDSRTGWRVRAIFQIELHRKDEALLKHIQAYLSGIGTIFKGGKDCLSFRVITVKDMFKIIYHFDKYPLITSSARFVCEPRPSGGGVEVHTPLSPPPLWGSEKLKN